MTTNLTNFLGQNWLITPAAPVVGNLNQREVFLDQTWLLVLTGIVEVDLQGNSTSEWLNETVTFLPKGLLYSSAFDSPPEGEGPLFSVLNQYAIQRPPQPYTVCFSLQDGTQATRSAPPGGGWAPFVSLSGISDDGQNPGFAVNLWRPTHFKKGVNVLTGGATDNVFNVFTGTTADLAVRDTDALILRLSYNTSLLGRIVFVDQGSLHD